VNRFEYRSSLTTQSALAEFSTSETPAQSRFIAGGTNLLDLMKEGLVRPTRLIDISRLPLIAIERLSDGGLRLGALARNAQTAEHPFVRDAYPLLRAAILAGASPQIRNMATNGGNLLQRTRCYYFYDVAAPCNKRSPGAGCSAMDGLARQHAIFGASPLCIATHPSDMCVALSALDATVIVQSAEAERRIPFAEFHRLPGEHPELDTELGAGELITAIELPPNSFNAHSAYLKIRDRASYAFALVSVAAALDLDSKGVIRDARIALGGVAHKPWRRREAEQLLVGKMPDEATFDTAAAVLVSDAKVQGAVQSSNAFKIPLARRAIVRALRMAAAGTLTNIGGPHARGGRP
jgi:xanthine dehydrogenase YagS FAD-binding subunit